MPSQCVIHQIPRKYMKKIKNFSLPSSAWSAVNEYIIKQICSDGESFTPVRFIQDGDRYDLGSVICKKFQTICELFGLKKPKARAVCMLEDLITSAEDITCDTSSAIKKPQDVPIDTKECYLFEGYRTNRRKRVVIKLAKCKRQVLGRLSRASGHVVDLYFCYSYGYSVDSLYVVQEVLYSQELKISVTEDGTVRNFRKKIRWPIGFKLCKWTIIHDSILQYHRSISDEQFRVRWRPFTRQNVARMSIVGEQERGYGENLMRTERQHYMNIAA